MNILLTWIRTAKDYVSGQLIRKSKLWGHVNFSNTQKKPHKGHQRMCELFFQASHRLASSILSFCDSVAVWGSVTSSEVVPKATAVLLSTKTPACNPPTFTQTVCDFRHSAPICNSAWKKKKQIKYGEKWYLIKKQVKTLCITHEKELC